MSQEATAAAVIGSASIYSLPDERIEDILRIASDDSSHRQTGINTLLACMRASRRIKSIGRTVLYEAPKPTHILAPTGTWHERNSSVQPRPLLGLAPNMMLGAGFSFDRALVLKHFGLLRTVESDTNLADSVRRLDIRAAFQHLEDSAADTPPEEHARSESKPLSGFDWQLRMLHSCHHVTHVGVVLRDVEQAKATGEALAAMQDLQHLTLYSYRPPQPDDDPFLALMGRQPPPSTSVCEREVAILEAFFAAFGVHPRRMTKISLRHFRIFDSPKGPTYSNLGRVVSSVADGVMISVTHLHNFSCLRTLLGPSSQLRQLEIMVLWWTHLPENNDPAYGELEGNHLTSVRIINSADASYATREHYPYPDVEPEPSYPNRLFRCFPHLRQLSLRLSYGMSLEKLSLLADTSPDIERIDFQSCTWIIPFEGPVNDQEEADSGDDTDDSDERVYDFVQFEKNLIDIFERWTNLEYVRLGLMPYVRTEDESATKSDAPLPNLAQWARSRGIKVEWQTFGPTHNSTETEGEGESSESESSWQTYESSEGVAAEAEEGEGEEGARDRSRVGRERLECTEAPGATSPGLG